MYLRGALFISKQKKILIQIQKVNHSILRVFDEAELIEKRFQISNKVLLPG